MQYIYSLLLIFLLWQCSSEVPPDIIEEPHQDTIIEPQPLDTTVLHVQIARANIGVPPKDSVNVWLSFVGLPSNNPWCAAAQSAWLHQAGVKSPLLKTGLARNYIFKTNKNSRISAGRVLAGIETVPKGSLVVFQRGNTIFGHIGTSTVEWTGADGIYISGNTSPPGGAEASGGGVWEKPIKINPNSYMRITDFVIVTY